MSGWPGTGEEEENPINSRHTDKEGAHAKIALPDRLPREIDLFSATRIEYERVAGMDVGSQVRFSLVVRNALFAKEVLQVLKTWGCAPDESCPDASGAAMARSNRYEEYTA